MPAGRGVLQGVGIPEEMVASVVAGQAVTTADERWDIVYASP